MHQTCQECVSFGSLPAVFQRGKRRRANETKIFAKLKIFNLAKLFTTLEHLSHFQLSEASDFAADTTYESHEPTLEGGGGSSVVPAHV